MPVSINNTTLTFNDATTQTTSAVTSVTAGTGISVTDGKTPTVTNTGVTSVTAGSGISVSAATGGVTISAAGGGVTSLNGQTGAITNTSLYAIGSYVMGRPANKTTDYPPNTTLAGSSLYGINSPGAYFDRNGEGDNGFWVIGSAAPTTVDLVNTGTWRCMTRAGLSGGTGMSGLWVRIS